MSDETTELREKLTERGVEWRDESNGYANVTMFTANGVDWCFITRNYSNSNTTLRAEHITPEQTIAATLGSERDEIYNAGFDNGIKATLHQLDGLLVKTDSAVEIQAWVDEQWKEYES